MKVISGGFGAYNAANSNVTNDSTHQLLMVQLEAQRGRFTDDSYYNELARRIDDNVGLVAINRTLALRKGMVSLEQDQDQIYLLGPTLSELQYPTLRMIPYLMANPIMRGLRRDGLINGYSNDYTFVDMPATEDLHYRQVIDGIYQERDDDADECLHMTVDHNGDSDVNPLDLNEQYMILSSWDSLVYQSLYSDDDIDPTSEWDESL